MDPVLDPLMEMGSTGAMVALILTAFKYLESKQSRRGGADLCARVTILENTVAELAEAVTASRAELDTFHKDFCEFREEVRLSWARTEAKEEAFREVKQAGG